MADKETRPRLAAAVSDLDEAAALELVKGRLEAGDNPLSIIDECEQGMRVVGERYEHHEYFLSGLIMAGEIFRQVMELVQPSLEQMLAGHVSGRVLIGTVQGDIHDLGKDMVYLALRSFGFSVEDLGVDVPPHRFLERALEAPPDIIGLSGVLTSSFGAMKETVRVLREEAPPSLRAIPIVIGGGMINEDICRYVGADYWASDGVEGVRLCRRLVQKDRA